MKEEIYDLTTLVEESGILAVTDKHVIDGAQVYYICTSWKQDHWDFLSVSLSQWYKLHPTLLKKVHAKQSCKKPDMYRCVEGRVPVLFTLGSMLLNVCSSLINRSQHQCIV